MLLDFLVEMKLAVSKSEARRLLLQGGIKVNNTTVSEDVKLESGDTVQVGKTKTIGVK